MAVVLKICIVSTYILKKFYSVNEDEKEIAKIFYLGF